MKPFKLDERDTALCVGYGRGAVHDYVTGRANKSLRYSSHGAETNVRLHIESKMAECILARALGLPIEPLFQRPFCDFDVDTPRVTIDVKGTSLHYKYLIWPLRKNELFAGKQFDFLALVKNDWNVGYPVGWIEKWEFFRRKQIAGEGHVLTKGTWHVDEEILEPIENLPGYGRSPPSLRTQIEAVEFAATRIGDRRKMKPSEREEHARRLQAAAKTLKQLNERRR
jgi:hypothetical protein